MVPAAVRSEASLIKMLSKACKRLSCTKTSIRAVRSMPPSNLPQHLSPQRREIKGRLFGHFRANTACHQANAAANVGHFTARANLN